MLLFGLLYCRSFSTHTDLNNLITKLDRRSSKCGRGSNQKHFKRLRRELSTPTYTDPPTNAPKWAVDASFRPNKEGQQVESLAPEYSDMYHFDLPGPVTSSCHTHVPSDSDSDFGVDNGIEDCEST